LSDAEALEQLAEFITKLPHRERKVLELRYGLSGNKLHTLEEIGLLIGCTRERVRQVQNCALKSLQNMHLDIKNNSDK
jgi:RNA polymerase primary sigma factor